MNKCKHCQDFFSKFRCAKTTIGECDCPKCQGYCECYLLPFNPALDEHLTKLGYERRREEASWEDAGDAESGPKLTGGPAYDEYCGPDEYVFASSDGVLAREPRNLDFERWIERQ